jgi:serine phosphatase RsbU (regulator of sigma subunit)
MRPVSLTSTLARVFRERTPLRIGEETIAALGEPHDLLLPFLEQGSTAIILPVATPAEVLATLTLVSLDPDRPIDAATVSAALAIAGQAALAVDNARLYQQQKLFADTMQRSLLPREHPRVDGLDVGAVYESDARVDVGGDLYDYLVLDDDRLAVVLGDVTGHGIDATADMAMAKFVFRSLAREHSSPGEFLAAANDVVASEVAAGKFITMLYLMVDVAGGELACAGGGHPPPRLILPDGRVESIEARGLVLGIDPGQVYEEVRVPFPVGATVVMYTDGVVEARLGHELFGVERLDATLAALADEPAQRIADAVLAACKSFAGGDIGDDCAIVVIRRTA